MRSGLAELGRTFPPFFTPGYLISYGRTARAVANALDRLVADGYALMISPERRRAR